MQLFLSQNGSQVGPYSEDQIRTAVQTGAVSQDDLVWHQGLPDWMPIRSVISLQNSQITAPPTPRTPQRIVETNVKQGAIIGGWVCFVIGLACMGLSLMLFFIYGPFFLVATILSIVAMAQRRIIGGVLLLGATLVVPSILGLVLFTTRTADMAKSIEEQLASSTSADSTNPKKAGDDPPTESFSDTIRKTFEDAERESDIGELNTLRKRKAQFEEKQIQLNDFAVLSAKFTKEEGLLGPEPVIEMAIQNNTPHPVKRAYFRGILTSPGRSIPWVDQTFNYEIAGGIEPGEEATWSLTPNMFSDWASAETQSDARLIVTVRRLDGPDGQELFNDAAFDDDDQKRLEELEKKYPD